MGSSFSSYVASEKTPQHGAYPDQGGDESFGSPTPSDFCNDACEQLGIVSPHDMSSPFEEPFSRELQRFAQTFRETEQRENVEHLGDDRDDRLMQTAHALSRPCFMSAAQPLGRYLGGSLCRATLLDLRGREDAYQAPRYVEEGFGRYVSDADAIMPTDYLYYRMAGWRVAVPRAASLAATQDLLEGIYRKGPAPMGYVRMGDTMVPQSLGPGNRKRVATFVDLDSRM